MGAIALLALWRGRATQSLDLLGVALIVVLLVRPPLLFSVGLHLSAAATAGIVVWAPSLATRFARLPRPIALALAATLAAQFAVIPILVSTFGEISLVAPVANVLAFPVVAPITVVGLGAGIAALAVPGAARLVMSSLSPLAAWVIEVGNRTGRLSWASMAIPSWWAGPLLGLISFAAWRSLRGARAIPDSGARDDAGMGDWHWKLHDEQGGDVRATDGFASKEEAEAWLGAEWRALADEGAGSVSLVQGDRVIYTMGLGEE
jgi:competence protein ComEC